MIKHDIYMSRSNDPTHRLFMALHNNNNEGILTALSEGANPNINEGNATFGIAPLNYAVLRRNSAEIINALIAHGADPNRKYSHHNINKPALFDAVVLPNNSENIRALIADGANPNATYDLLPPLFFAFEVPNNSENIEALIDGGANTDDYEITNGHTLMELIDLNHDESNRAILQRLVNWNERKNAIMFVEGTPQATGHISKITHGLELKEALQYMGYPTGGKHKTKRNKRGKRGKKSRKHKSKR